jgi:hypothetical protein
MCVCVFVSVCLCVCVCARARMCSAYTRYNIHPPPHTHSHREKHIVLGAGSSSRVFRGVYGGKPVAIKMIFCVDLTPETIRNLVRCVCVYVCVYLRVSTCICTHYACIPTLHHFCTTTLYSHNTHTHTHTHIGRPPCSRN